MGETRREQYRRIVFASTTVVKAAPGTLWRVVVGKPIASSTITIYDSLTGSGNGIAVITNTTDVKPYSLDFGCYCQNGITVVTSGNDDLLVIYG